MTFCIRWIKLTALITVFLGICILILHAMGVPDLLNWVLSSFAVGLLCGRLIRDSFS